MTVEHIDAIVLSGGSAWGLAAADGAMSALASQMRGFPVGRLARLLQFRAQRIPRVSPDVKRLTKKKPGSMSRAFCFQEPSYFSGTSEPPPSVL